MGTADSLLDVVTDTVLGKHGINHMNRRFGVWCFGKSKDWPMSCLWVCRILSHLVL